MVEIIYIKDKDAGNYWCDLESIIAHYYFYWENIESLVYFKKNMREFNSKFKEISIKYGISIPLECFAEIQQPKEILDINDFFLHNANKSLFPTILAKGKPDLCKFENIYAIDPIMKFEDLHKHNIQTHYSLSRAPIEIEFVQHQNLGTYLAVFIHNDIYFPYLINRKTLHYFENIIIEKYEKMDDYDLTSYGVGVDATYLYNLNSTRINSFIRDVKKLCNEFGGVYKKGNYDLLGEGFFNENGIQLDGKVIYYEDVYDTIPDKLKYRSKDWFPYI